MKLKNELIVICLILFILISTSAVAAADNNTDVITINNDDNTLSIDDINDEEILTDESDGNFADLNNKINGDSSTNIVLDKNYTYSSTDTIKDGIVISKNNTIIDGQGHTIDAKGQSRMFNVTATTVTLKNIKFINGNVAGTGGAIRGYGENLRVINCTFIDNNASSWGGAIYSYPDSYTIFVNSTFINNNAECGGAIATCYGMLHNIINCTFDSNTASVEGGAVVIHGQLGTTERPYNDQVNIRSCLFTNNDAPEGEAISNRLSAYINMTDSIILGNPENVIYSWGAMFFADYNWWGNTVDNASAKPKIVNGVKFTKWLYMDFVPNMDTSSATVSINNLYDSNAGQKSTYSTSKLPSINVKFQSVNATLDVDNADLDHSGKYELNFVLLGDSILTANCSNSIVTKKIGVGGLSELALLISNAQDGDVIKLEKDYVYTEGADSKVGISISDKNNLVIDGNGYTINGMGQARLFNVYDDSEDITFKNLRIVNGFSNDGVDGAGAYVSAYNTKFVNCTFINNTAIGYGTGGALHINAHHVSVEDSKFINNTHKETSAGAIYWRGEDAVIINTLFEDNKAFLRAGAIFLNDGGNVVNCTFIHNGANEAGATFNYDTAIIDGCKFISNVASATSLGSESSGAGAVYATNTTITNSMFVNNTAIGGAAVVIGSSSASIDKSIFINNTATSPNGIILGVVEGGKVTNSIFLNNDDAHGYVISTIWGKLQADYNWYGNIAKNYDSNYHVSNLAIMSKWLFVNATQPVFFDDGKCLTTQFNFFAYDQNTKQVISYNPDNLPEFNFTISTINLTLDKNLYAPSEMIEGNLTYAISIGEEGYVYRYDTKGTITAEYANVKYVLPFSFQRETWFEVNSTFEMMKEESKYLSFTLHPFEQDYLPFLNRAGRLTYIVNDTSVIKINRTTGIIKALKVGLATITIKFDGKDVMGRDRYLPSNVTVLVNVTKGITSIVNSTSIPNGVNVGDNSYIVFNLYNYKNRTVSGNYELEFINNDDNVIQITSTGPHTVNFKTIGEGMANVTVKFNGNDDYLPSSMNVTFEVGRLNPNLKVDPNNITMKLGDQYYIGISSRSPSNFTYIYSNPNVAIIEDEVVRAIGEGITNITIKFDGDSKYLPGTAYLIVNVTADKTYIDVNQTCELLLTDDKYLNAAVRDMNGKLISYSLDYASNDTNVVTVDEHGKITAINEGVANITVVFKGHDEYLPSQTYVIVTSTIGTSSIDVNSSIDISFKHRMKLDAKLNHEGDLNYSSSNPDVVSVDKYGYISANSMGEANITITYEGSQKYYPCSANVTVKVVKAPTSINVEKTFAWMIDENDAIVATLSPKAAGKLNFTSNNESIVIVDNNGKVSAVGVGQTTILVSFAGNENYLPSNETIDVTVYPSNFPVSIEVNKTFALFIDDAVDISAVLHPSNAGNLSYASSNPDIVSVDENGTMTAKKVGGANITISFAGNDRYLANSTTVKVTVSEVSSEISVDSNVEMGYNEKLNLNATLNHEGNLTYVSSNSSVVSVDKDGIITAENIGEANITITYGGSDKFKACSATVNVNVSKATTSIDVDKIFALIIDKNDTIVAVLNPDVASLVFTSNNESIVKVDNTGKISAINVGKTTVLISYDGNEYYLPSNATVEVSVYSSDIPTSIEVNKTFDLHVDDVIDIGAILNPANAGKLNYSSNNSNVVSVYENGTVVAKKVGKASITISFAGNDRYLANSTAVTVTVTEIPSEISVDSHMEINYKESANINAVLNHDGNLSYVSNNPSVASVDKNGNITANNVGEANITISYAGSDKYKPCKATVNVKVCKAPTSIDVEKIISCLIDYNGNIAATLNPNVGRLTFTSNNESIVVVDNKGKFSAVGVGKTTILISFAGNDKYLPSNETVEVTVYPGNIPTSIDANKTFELHVDDKVNIGAILNPSNAGDLTYTSSNPDVVSVDSKGVITAKKIGQANITVSFNGNDRYLANSTSALVTVSLIPTDIKAVDSITVNLTESAKLDYTFSNPEAGKLKFIFSDIDVASIESGKIIGDEVGKTNLTIKFEGNEKYAASNATVEINVVDVETTIDVADSIKVNVTESGMISASLNPKEAGKLRFISNNKDIISVDGYGNVRGIKLGTGTVTVIFEGNGKYRATNKTVNVTVCDVETSIEVNDTIDVNVTESASIIAKANPSQAGKLHFATNDSSIISIDDKGNIKGLKVGTANVVITLDANGKYRQANKTVTVTVCDVATEINVDNENLKLVYGDETNVNATLTPDVGKLTYASNDSDVVFVDEKGNVKAIKPGVATITVSYAGEGKYRPFEKNITVTVGRAPSSIKVNDNMTMEIGLGYRLNIVTNPKNMNLTFTSSDNETVNVEQDNFIFAYQKGKAIITVSFDGDEYYLPSNATINVTVSSRATEIHVNRNVTLGFGEEMDLGAKIYHKAAGSYMSGKLSYVSSDENIVTVDANGKITACDVGKATINITYDGDTTFDPAFAVVNVEVTTRTTHVRVDQPSVNLHVDDTYNITAKLEDGPESYMLTYMSNDPNVARVNPLTGEVTAVADGKAIITVSYAGDDDYHSSSANVSISVSKYTTRINAETSYDMVVYDEVDLKASVSPNQGALTYTSSDDSVVTVKNGKATALKSGNAVITIKFEGDRKYLPSQKEVFVSVAKIPTSINLTDIELLVGDTYKLENIVIPDGVPTRAKYYEFISWDTEIFDVVNGVLETYIEGSEELYVGFLGDDIYLPSNKTVNVIVVKKVISSDEYNFTAVVKDEDRKAIFTVELPQDAEGLFTVRIDGDTYSEPIVDGVATITVDELDSGDHKVTLRYTGDEKYTSITNNTEIHIGNYKIDKNKDISVLYKSKSYVTYKIHLTRDTQAIEGKKITFKFNGKKYYAYTDELGYAKVKVKLPATPKKYTITAQFSNVKVSNKVNIKHIVVAKNLKVKKSSSSVKIKVSLKKVNKKYLKGKKLTLKFKGKKFTAKTNKKGVATFTIKKNVYKKLKVDKKYTYKVTYLKDTVSKKITIKK